MLTVVDRYDDGKFILRLTKAQVEEHITPSPRSATVIIPFTSPGLRSRPVPLSARGTSCWLFAALMRLGIVPEEICAQCADIWEYPTLRSHTRAPQAIADRIFPVERRRSDVYAPGRSLHAHHPGQGLVPASTDGEGDRSVTTPR